MADKPKWKDRVKSEMTSWFKLISSTNKGGMSNDFFELIKAIGEAKSKQEEDKIVESEAKVLQSIINQPENAKNMKEYVIRLVYCAMLGHDVSFGYINAVKMTQEPKILDKRVGYLAASTFLHRDHEFIILLISSFRRDLVSSNHLHVCAALTTITYLINVETIPAILPLVVDLLQHERGNVRKKAVMSLQRFYLLSPDSISHLHDHIRRVLCDRDPSVMGATLCLLKDLIKDNKAVWKDLVPSFVNILKQVILNKLSRHYEYHHVPAPWIQIKLLRLLGMLGADDKKSSELMYETLGEVLKKASGKNNASYAVSYECIKTVTTIYPRPTLLELAAESISTFITSTSNNLKYLGIDALGIIVQIDPRHAQKHQLQVIGCLQDPDDTLKRKTLDLLYKMTNPMNVVTITDKLIQHLRQTQDQYLRTELVSRITQLAERYAPDNEWFIETMIQVFLLGGELVRPLVAHNLMQLIAEGTEDEEADVGLRMYAVTAFYSVLSGQRETPGGMGLAKKERLPDILVHLGAWVLSEYAYLSDSHSIPQILSVLSELIEKPHIDSATRGWLITAIMKLVAQVGSYPPLIEDIVTRYKRSLSLDLQQRCYEFEAIVQNPSLIEEVLPLDASMEDVEVDQDLSFLDEFVQNAIARGAKSYLRPSERVAPISKKIPKSLNWEKYETPVMNTYNPKTPPHSVAQPVAHTNDTTSGLTVKPGKWSAKGYSELPLPSTPVPSTPTPSAPPSESLRTPPHQPTVAQEPAVMADPRQQRMAEELFAGLGLGAGPVPPESTGNRKARRPLGAKKADSKSRTQQHSEEKDAVSMFIGLSTSTAQHDVSTETQRSHPTRVGDLLLDLDFGFQETAPRPSVFTVSPQAPSSSEQLFAGMSFSPATGAPSFTVPHRSLLLDEDDPLEPGGTGGAIPLPLIKGEKELGGITPTKMVLSQHHHGNLDFSKMIFPTNISNHISASRSSDVNKPLAEDAAMHLSYYLSYKENETVAVLFIANKTDSNLSNVVTTLNLPANLNVSCVTNEGGEINQAEDQVEVSFSHIPGQSVVVVLLLFTFREHSFNMNMKITVAYSDNKLPRHVIGNIPLLITQLLRPHKMNSSQYGEKWLNSKQETKTRVTCPKITDTQSLVNTIAKQFNLMHVHTIGMEAIFSGKLIGAEALCLLHAKLIASATVEITVRTTNKFYTDSVVRCAERLLQ